jgi:hypothetical protein
MNISDLNISIRDINAISRSGCTTVEELRQKISDDMDGMKRQLGFATFERIEDALAEISGVKEQTPAVIVSEDYTKAITLTRSIIANAQAAQQSLYEVCKGLKEMRDGKLYKELGYQNFEDYTENEVGIKRRQAYGYISVAENLPEEFVHSSAQIGIKKLELLAKLDEPTRETVTETVDVESATVKELKAQITALTNDKNKLESETADLAQQLDAAQETIQSKSKLFEDFAKSKNRDIARISGEKSEAAEKLRKKSAEYVKAQNRILSLEKQIKELENRPVEVAVSEDESKEIERLQSELEDAKLRVAQADKMIAAKVERSAELLRAEYEEKIAKIQSPEPDPDELRNAKYWSLKHIFEELIDELEDVLNGMADDKRITLVDRIIHYCTDNLTYLKEKRDT